MNFFTWLKRNAHGLRTMMNNELNIVDGKCESWRATKDTAKAVGATSSGTASTADLPECSEVVRSTATPTAKHFRSSCGTRSES